MTASDRLLCMSAFYGLLALRRYSVANRGVDLRTAVAVVKKLSSDDAYHDYDAALTLDELVPDEYVHSPDLFFREIIWSVLRFLPPWWARLAPYGRDKIRNALTPNEAQCFAAAGLFANIPNSDVLAWWDRFAQTVRALANDGKLEQGREAERLTIEYERKRLKELGIELEPRWVSIDDNAAGYDIQSFDPGTFEPIAKLIEVKSCARESIAFYLTRNEWAAAISSSPNYRFHLWLLPEKELIEFAPSEIELHVPTNCGSGTWESAKIALQV